MKRSLFSLVTLLTVLLPTGPTASVGGSEINSGQILQPVANIPVKDRQITIQLVNETQDAVVFQAIGDTEPRVLEGKSAIPLQNLRLPANLTFFYQNFPKDALRAQGLLQATIQPNPTTGILVISLQPTTDRNLDASSVSINAKGWIYVF